MSKTSLKKLVYQVTAMTVAFSPLAGHAAPKAQAKKPLAKWVQFQKDPKSVMGKIPAKKNKKGKVIKPAVASAFPLKNVKNGEYIKLKGKARLKNDKNVASASFCNAKGVCLDQVIAGRSEAQTALTDFLDMREFQAKNLRPIYKLDEIEAKGLMSAKLSETPWSDTYWPIYQGQLGARYADGQFNSAYDEESGSMWVGYNKYVTKPENTLAAIYKSKDASKIDTLSPSEKYDLLIGDLTTYTMNGTVLPASSLEKGYLTPSQWKSGESYHRNSGKVEEWMGLCHGWAPAAFMAPRPSNSIKTTAADGQTSIKWYPSDLKGLATYSWGTLRPTTTFVGGRCNVQDPETDPETGRVLAEECNDVNPGTWHLGVVNQLGQAKRSFVIDATYDYQVWNQPMYSYTYTYFNPQTGEPVSKLSEATVKMADFTKDKFKKFRSPKAVAVVGVNMDIQYIVEGGATHAEIDKPENDSITGTSYMYDLEIDANGNVIGGEWYENSHPDFLWLPLESAKITTQGDRVLSPGDWSPDKGALPKFWRDIAIAYAYYRGQPLQTIVDSLIKASHTAAGPVNPELINREEDSWNRREHEVNPEDLEDVEEPVEEAPSDVPHWENGN